MHFAERRISIGQLDGGDAQRPDITAHVIRVIQLLLASDDLCNSTRKIDTQTKTNIEQKLKIEDWIQEFFLPLVPSSRAFPPKCFCGPASFSRAMKRRSRWASRWRRRSAECCDLWCRGACSGSGADTPTPVQFVVCKDGWVWVGFEAIDWRYLDRFA